MKKFFLFSLCFLFFWLSAGSALAYVAASSNYRLEKDSINFGGLDEASSTNYKASTTLGEIISGVTSGTNYNASSGYRYMILDPVAPTTTSVPGCTDPTANNYNSSATVDDGSCTYSGGPVTVPVPGCTNPLALNYNPSATVDNGSCILSGVPNVSNFSAVYQEGDKRVHLTWQNPSYADLASIVIRRQKDSVPSGPTSGQLIYNGTNQSTYDYDIEVGAHYYYAAFVRSTSNNYSSGVVTSVTIPTPTEVVTPVEVPTETPTVPPGGPSSDPFSSLPVAPGGEVTSSLSEDWSFLFLQPKELAKVFDRFMSVRVDGDKPITIYFKYNLAPATTETIGVTLTNPDDKTKTFSFLLRRTKDGSAFQATIGALKRRGTYPMDVYIINNNQTIKHIKGRLIASSALMIQAETTIKKVVAPTAIATGLAVSFLPSFYDLLVHLFRLLPYIFGRRRKGESWGTVYDSETKRPLDPVYVTAEQTDPATQKMKEIASAITDIDGRFGFFLPAGIYYLKANKTHYRFPSTRLAGRTNDETYGNLYFGGEVKTEGEEVINLNIPMDPIDFDWNEFAKTKTDFFRFYNRRQLWLNRFWHVFFMSGFLFSIYISYLQPLLINFVVVGFYPVLFLLDRFYHEKRKPLKVTNARTNEPLPFAIIRVFLPNLNQQIKYAVADQYGRFYVLVRPGVYYYTVEEKMPDGSYQKVYQSNPVNLSKGVLTADISVK